MSTLYVNFSVNIASIFQSVKKVQQKSDKRFNDISDTSIPVELNRELKLQMNVLNLCDLMLSNLCTNYTN